MLDLPHGQEIGMWHSGRQRHHAFLFVSTKIKRHVTGTHRHRLGFVLLHHRFWRIPPGQMHKIATALPRFQVASGLQRLVCLKHR